MVMLKLSRKNRIHPTAVIGSQVSLAPDVEIGPFALLEGRVTVGRGCRIEGHSCLSGPLTMGEGNVVGHGAVLGKAPQSRGHGEDRTSLVIGDNNIFREYVTIHRGTEDGGGETRIGDNNYLMVGAHLGHDVRMGNNCTVVNGALVGGHAQLMDGCVLSGQAVMQQRTRIGRLAMLGGQGATTKDIPPFILAHWHNCTIGLNLVGMKRSGMSNDTINALREVFRIVYQQGMPMNAALDRCEQELGAYPEVREFVEFVRTSKTGINPYRNLAAIRRKGDAHTSLDPSHEEDGDGYEEY